MRCSDALTREALNGNVLYNYLSLLRCVPKLNSVNSEYSLSLFNMVINKNKMILGIDRVEFWNATLKVNATLLFVPLSRRSRRAQPRLNFDSNKDGGRSSRSDYVSLGALTCLINVRVARSSGQASSCRERTRGVCVYVYVCVTRVCVRACMRAYACDYAIPSCARVSARVLG